MTDTRHLDTALEIFKGKETAKRAKRAVQADIHVWVYSGWYQILVNGKEVANALGSKEAAVSHADNVARSIRSLGKTVNVTVY